MNASGEIFYKDEYQTIYNVAWATVNGVIDITSIVQQPYVWGEIGEGYILNNVVYRIGVITIQRQILKVMASGVEVVAEGTVQYVDFFQTTFPCGRQPEDRFRYHLNYFPQAEVEMVVTDGSHWSTIEENGPSVWPVLEADGSVAVGTGSDPLSWIDVWS